MSTRIRRQLLRVLPICLTLLIAAPALEAAKPAPKSGIATRQTQALTKQTYTILEAAQTLYDDKKYPESMAKLGELQQRYDKLNDYEKAVYWNFRAGIDLAQDKPEQAFTSYTNVLRQQNLPDLLRQNTLYAMAQLSFGAGRYQQAIKIMRQWIAQSPDGKPEPWMLIAQAQYQLKDYRASEKAAVEGLRVAKQKAIAPKESWLSLLRALYYEIKEYGKSAHVLEVLAQRWPRTSYWLQLAGLYGLNEKPEQQLAVLRANYEAGTLTNGSDQINLARLYLLQKMPYPAAEVLRKGLANKQIEETASSLQLYAQALNMAREHQREIETLNRLAKLTGESRYWAYLGQAHMSLGQWADAEAAYRQALRDRKAERPGTFYMQIGSALYNLQKYSEARKAFQSALAYPESAREATAWVGYINKELAAAAQLQ